MVELLSAEHTGNRANRVGSDHDPKSALGKHGPIHLLLYLLPSYDSALACAISLEALSSCNNALQTTAKWSDLNTAVAEVLIASDAWMVFRQSFSTHACMSTFFYFYAGDEQWSSEEGDHTILKVLCSRRDRFRDLAELVVSLCSGQEPAVKLGVYQCRG